MNHSLLLFRCFFVVLLSHYYCFLSISIGTSPIRKRTLCAAAAPSRRHDTNNSTDSLANAATDRRSIKRVVSATAAQLESPPAPPIYPGPYPTSHSINPLSTMAAHMLALFLAQALGQSVDVRVEMVSRRHTRASVFRRRHPPRISRHSLSVTR